MPELFVELLSEEVPARMQRKAAGDLKRLVTDALVEAGLTYEGAMATAGPRRLVLSVHGLPGRSLDRTAERRGPRVGAPRKALDGFMRAAGLASIEEAEVVSDGKKGEHYLARTVVPGRPAIDICADALGATVRRFPFPVSMRWGEASVEADALRWVRPLTSVIATFGAENEDPEIVPVTLPVPVGDATVGHRVHAPGAIKVRRFDDYADALFAAKVVVDLDRRRDTILADARDRVFALGLELVEDERLLEEVAGLVEWPVVLVGRFDEASLALPDEVIRLTIRENQKCFVTRDPATPRLANAFVLTANLEASDGGAAIIAGNERVVRARLADARFFYEQDRKKSLAEHAEKLKTVTFHEKLGMQWDRVERIAALAEALAAAPHGDLAAQAARLCKADLTTEMVGEFPELQGYMGRRYAEAEELSPEVAAALEEHYAPQGPSDAVPTAPVSVAVALADKIDSLVSLWIAGEKPTGSGDPFALRRAALGILRISLENELPLEIHGLVRTHASRLIGTDPNAPTEAVSCLADEIVTHFLADRYERLEVDAGHKVEVVRAATFAEDGVPMHLQSRRRMLALEELLSTDAGANLLAGYKRAANILDAERKKDAGVADLPAHFDEETLVEPEERALGAALETARHEGRAAIERQDYSAAMAALAELRGPIDAFFDKVTVNADDPELRRNRLRLLASVREATRRVADFSQIPG